MAEEVATSVKPITVFVRVEADVALTLSEVWPDGNWPDNPTAEDVKAVMEADGPRHHVLDDWGVLDGLTVHVAVDRGAEVEVWPHD